MIKDLKETRMRKKDASKKYLRIVPYPLLHQFSSQMFLSVKFKSKDGKYPQKKKLKTKNINVACPDSTTPTCHIKKHDHAQAMIVLSTKSSSACVAVHQHHHECHSINDVPFHSYKEKKKDLHPDQDIVTTVWATTVMTCLHIKRNNVVILLHTLRCVRRLCVTASATVPF